MPLSSHQPMAVHDGMDGAAGGYADIVGQFAQQAFPKLASAPSWFLSPQGDDHRFELGGKLVGVAVGSWRLIRYAFQPALFIAFINFVAGYPGDAELAAQRGHALPVLEPQYKPHAFFHDGPFLPWHRQLLAGLIQPGVVNHVSGTFCTG